jgi:predicted butyrate kinase (DUF1464 family)
LVRVAGIDPGTKSMDVCALQDGEVYFEKVVGTEEVANNPQLLIEAVEEAMPLDLIVGPSGYGIELTYLSDLPEDSLEDWYYRYILLAEKGEVEEAVKGGVFGALIYYAMAKTAVEMRRRRWPVCYIPAVIHLPTVPEHRKVNKIDLGTADKMCAAVLGVYDQSRRLGIPYSEVSFIQVEMGFGYNAVLAVDGGRIVDGVGGTTMGGPGFLTISSLDAELAQLVGEWRKEDLFTGGCASISGKATPEELIANIQSDSRCGLAWRAMAEGILKAVHSMKVSVQKPKEILISGRLTKIRYVEEWLVSELGSIAPVRRLEGLPGAKMVKETAQGYALVADGLAGGKYKELVEWMKIKEAKGTALDYIYHPKFYRKIHHSTTNVEYGEGEGKCR